MVPVDVDVDVDVVVSSVIAAESETAWSLVEVEVVVDGTTGVVEVV